MANLSEDIQCVGSDTQPPMLDSTNFASWQRRIRLYCQGKKNGVNILKLIDVGPFQMGTVRETLVEGTVGAPHLGPKRPRVYSDHSLEEKDRYNADIRATNILLQGLPKDIYTLINHYTDANDICDNVKMLLEGSELRKEDRESQLTSTTSKTKMLLMQTQENGVALDEEQLLFLTGEQDNAIDEDVDEQPVQDSALNLDNVFQADDCDAFDSDVDEASMAQTMFMANLSSADPVYDKAGPSYDSDILFEPALYYGHEVIKNNNVPAIVHNTEDTLEIAEITRRKINDKMKDPECVKHKVKIAPHDYSKENFIATFTSQKQLTPEQIFWSQDLIKMKTDSLKEQTIALRPIKALMVYPPNIPTTLVPRVLPTKSQVKNHIFTLIQLFLEFDKTCKKRITPTELTEGEMGFEQTKECYLKEVAQNDVVRKHDEIERKNLFIANDNLIAECLSKEVFYVATNSELNVSRFTEMDVAHTIVEARCLELEAELSNLRDKIHNDNHNELVNRFSNLEVHHLNLQLKYTNLEHSFGNNPPTPAKDTSDFDPVFVIRKMQASLQGKDNVIKQLKKKISHLLETSSEADRTLDFRTLDSQITKLTEKVTVLQAQNDIKNHVNPTVLASGKYATDVEPIPSRLRNNKEAHLDYLRHLKESVETIRKIVEEAKVVRPLDSSIVSACCHTKHSQELLEYAIGTCCSKHMTGDRSRLMNFIKKFIGTVRFGNDHFGAIMGYGDYVIGDNVISRHSCYVHDTDGVELIKGYRDSNLYTISVEDMMKSSPICLLFKASKNKSWLWHHRLNHLNFGTINDLARKDLVRGLPRLKFEKDHICSACQLEKSKKHTHKHKTKNTNLEVLNTLHMDICGPMRVQTINGKKYILVIVDDYSQFTWVKFLRSKDETSKVVNKFLQQIETPALEETLAEGTEGASHLGPGRPRVYSDLSPEEKERYNADIRASNILLQGFPKDIYTLINHYTDAKDIWDNVKMLLEGLELTKKDRGRFVTAVKLNRGLRDSNYDQLYAYLKQPEAHANENKMMLDRFTQHTVDPFALMSNVSHQQHYSQSSTTPPSTYVPPYLADNAHLDLGLSLMYNLIENLTNMLALLTQSYKTFLPQTNNQLRTLSNTKNQAIVQDGRVVVQNVQGRLNRGQGNNPWGRGNIARNCTQPKRSQNSDYFKDKMFLMQAQENGVTLEEKQLLFLVDDCDAFDSDVDEALMAQTMFMTNLSSADPVYDEVSPSHDLNILSEVHDHDHYQDAICEHHEEHEVHDNVQPNHVVDSHADYTSDSNMISYDQYVKDNAMPGVQSIVSYVPNDAYMMIYNDMYEPHAQSVSKTSQNMVVDNPLTAELTTYKKQVELYERRARFELTEREKKIDEQLRIVIIDHNFKEETLKKELHSVKLQLASTINHNKSMVEEVTSLKKDFKQKENKYLEEFLDMKSLKEKVEDRLYKQDQSLQTVHMLCKPKPYYNELNKVAIGYKNPLCLTQDTLEIAEMTMRKMNDKMKDPECVNHKVKIAPHDYSKWNFLATYTPQKQLTPEQIFWSQYLIKMKAEALKEQTTASRPIKALTVYPPNIPATLVLRVLPTKSQVKINIFTLIQLFLEFDKTCKKRITPTGLTEGERGSEQTNECYHKEVIPFFKTLKEHFEGIQKALTKEIKEIKDVFEELEAMVDQKVVDRKHDEIEQKNLLIANDNLIVECLSKEVFYVATNSELNVSRFTEMHVAHIIVEARCLELEAKLSNLRDKIHNDNHNELVNRFPILRALDSQITQLTEKVNVLQEQNDLYRAENEKIKQHYKELYDSIKITRAKHIERTTALITENVNLKAQILNNVNSVIKDHVKPTVLAPGKYAIDVEPIPPRIRNNREVHLDYLRHLKESVKTLHEIVEEAKVVRPLDSSIVSACRYTKHSQELLEYAIDTYP
nr:hypothetical protein [Tanacetum cinerariifolium]